MRSVTLCESGWRAHIANEPDYLCTVYDLPNDKGLLLIVNRGQVHQVNGYHIDTRERKMGLAIVLDLKSDPQAKCVRLHNVVAQGCKPPNYILADFEAGEDGFTVIARGMLLPEYEDANSQTVFTPEPLRFVLGKQILLYRRDANGGK